MRAIERASSDPTAMKRSNVRGAKGPCHLQSLQHRGRQGRDDKGVHRFARPEAEDIRQGEAEPSWRFWGLYVHVCKVETLRAAYEMANRTMGLRE